MLIDIIILLVLIVVIYTKLKNVLGTRPEGTQQKISKEKAEAIFDILMKEAEQTEEVINKGEITPNTNLGELSDLDKTLLSIPNFNKEIFINNSKKAFDIILESFSEGDIETLKSLVGSSLFKKFKDVVDTRKKDGITSEMELISINSVEIKDAKISKNNIAKIIVQFISEQINILKDAKGKVIEGDANFIQSITDIWTFERNLNSTSPVWLLTSTKK